MKLNIPLFAVLCVLLANCGKEPFSQGGMAEDHFFLRNAGQSMQVTVAGNLDARKMLVILHGGPGGDALAYRNAHVKAHLEPEIAVVYWTQRYAATAQGNAGEQDIVYFRDDLRKLVQLLRQKYGDDQKIYLFGHSWGGFLLPYFMISPENSALVDGFIQVDGAHNYPLNDSLVHSRLFSVGQQEITAFRNVSFWQNVIFWCAANGYEGEGNAARLNQFAHQAETYMPAVAPRERGASWDEVLDKHTPLSLTIANSFVSGGLRRLYLPAYNSNVSDSLSLITKPGLLLWGRYDFVCDIGLLAELQARLGSTDLSTQIFEHSGHSPMLDEPDLFWQTVIQWLQTH